MKTILLSTAKPHQQGDKISEKAARTAGCGGGWGRAARERCRQQLSLSGVPAHAFTVTQWQTQPRPTTHYLLYRWAVLIFSVSTAVSAFVCQEQVYPPDWTGPRVPLNRAKWFIYLTNWGFLLIVTQAALALCVLRSASVHLHTHLCAEGGGCGCGGAGCGAGEARTPLLCRVYWVTHTVAADLSLVISLVYWLVVHDPKVNRVTALNVLMHGANSLLMVVEVCVSALPVRPLHALYTVLFGLAYSAFTLVYRAAGGTDRAGAAAIYKPLDWRVPARALAFVAGCACLICLAHALLYALSRARAALARRPPPPPPCLRSLAALPLQ